jgi:K(+)-stimulated pyrophosphate-energized sodium pump
MTGLFGGTIIFIIFGKAAPDALLGFGLEALDRSFMLGRNFHQSCRCWGGPGRQSRRKMTEDDPRNAAVVADTYCWRLCRYGSGYLRKLRSHHRFWLDPGLALVAVTGDLNGLSILIIRHRVISSILGHLQCRFGKIPGQNSFEPRCGRGNVSLV